MKEEEKEKSKKQTNRISVNPHPGRLPVGSSPYALSWPLSETLLLPNHQQSPSIGEEPTAPSSKNRRCLGSYL